MKSWQFSFYSKDFSSLSLILIYITKPFAY